MNSSNIDPTNEIAGLVISPGASRLRGTAICRRWIAACRQRLDHGVECLRPERAGGVVVEIHGRGGHRASL